MVEICPSFIERSRLRFAKRASERLGKARSTIGLREWLTLLVGLLSVSTAAAQTPITGSYATYSVTTLRAGIAPPPGTVVLENGSVFYSSDKFVDSSGNTFETPTTNVYVNRTTIGYVVPGLEILGADFFPAVFPILSDQVIRPVPGSERELQLGDIIVQPVALGWHAGVWHALASYNLFIPTGRFEAGASNNTGKGLYSHMLSGAVTWLQEVQFPWIATAQVRYEIYGRQKTTDIRPGQVMTIELAGGKELLEGLDLAISGALSFQTTEESGSPPGTDTSKYRYAGLGPEVHWRPASLPGAQVSLRAYFEFGARNTSQGMGALISLMYAF